jgi:hypothetical protein
MRKNDTDLSRLVSYFTDNEEINIDISKHFHTSSDPLNKLNAAFLLILSSKSEQSVSEAENYLHDCLNLDETVNHARFYIHALEEIEKEFSNHRQTNSQFDQHVSIAISAIVTNKPASEIQECVWQIFFPEAVGMSEDDHSAIAKLRNKRKVDIHEINPEPVRNPGKEVLFTSNILLTMPLDMDTFANSDHDPSLKKDILSIKNEKQKFWYDHPIPLGIPVDKNEVLYGINGLDQAVQFEIDQKNYSGEKKVTCLLSASVTHDGLHHVAKKYIENEFENHVKIKNLDVYVFTETDTDAIIEEILVPAARKYLNLNLDKSDLDMFGVDGEYGRHYSFLKAISVFWQIFIDPDKRATFKIDLDQVFPQETLVKETGVSAFGHLTSALWGAQGVDEEGNPVLLDMIAGALVNEKDILKSLFTPDVPIPSRNLIASEQVFFSYLPQSISTEAEMMTKYDTASLDGQKNCLQRIHVTGGTNGILIRALRKYMPFTPSFFGRAEDQAYIMSTFGQNDLRLGYLHKPGLIMRHDKEAFAQEAMAAAKVGKMIGDYVRIIYFSAYARLFDPELDHIKKFLDPFTGGFISFIPKTVVYLRFALQAADLYEQQKTKMANEFVSDGSIRIREAIDFVKDKKQGMTQVYQTELKGWKLYYNILTVIENALNTNHTYAQKLRKMALEICNNCRIS